MFIYIKLSRKNKIFKTFYGQAYSTHTVLSAYKLSQILQKETHEVTNITEF